MVGLHDKVSLNQILNEKGIPSVVADKLPVEDRESYVFGGQYSLVDDSSMKPKLGQKSCEIRSFVFNINELDKHRPLFIALKENGMIVNARCGLHIHVSSDKTLSASSILNESRGESVRVRRCRKEWCVWNTKKRGEHYHAVNQRSPFRVEFRWFNGSLDFRYLCKMIRLVDSYCKG